MSDATGEDAEIGSQVGGEIPLRSMFTCTKVAFSCVPGGVISFSICALSILEVLGLNFVLVGEACPLLCLRRSATVKDFLGTAFFPRGQFLELTCLTVDFPELRLSCEILVVIELGGDVVEIGLHTVT